MLLRQRVDLMMAGLNMAQLFPVPPTIHFRPEEDTCEPCNVPLQVQKTRLGKRAATLAIGEFAVHETVLWCPTCASVHHSEELRGIIPPGANFGYDIMVFVGRMLFLQFKGYQDIREALRDGPFLQNLRSQYGEPRAVVSDMGKGFALAIAKVFPAIPAYICHFHFLKAVGTELLGEENDSIRSSLRAHKVRASLLATRERLEARIATAIPGLDAVIDGVAGHPLSPDCPRGDVPTAAAYALVSWALNSDSEGDGLGFPFDQSYLEFYRRIVELYRRMEELFHLHLQGDWKENRCYGWVLHDLHSVIIDTKLKETVVRMEEKGHRLQPFAHCHADRPAASEAGTQ